MPKAIIKVENLSVIYNMGKTSEFTALQDINIEIYDGEFVIFFGPSGCGKSTLLYCLAGLEIPTKGKITIGNQVITGASPRELDNLRRVQIGMIFQAYNLIPSLTVLNNVLLPTVLGESLCDLKIKRAHDLLDRFGIDQFSNRFPRDLSGGQQQRVAIARSLVVWPPILLGDEPTGNLDAKSTDVVLQYLLDLNKNDGKTIVLVTHDPTQLVYAHRIFHMKSGQLMKISVNDDRKQVVPEAKSASNEVDIIAKNNPQLSEIQLKAKALTQYILTSLGEMEVKRLESVIGQRIAGQINSEQTKELLDKPFEEGGGGLYKKTAVNFAQQVERILAEAEFIESEKNREVGISEMDFRVVAARRYLLDDSKVSFDKEDDLLRFERFIRLRLDKKIDREHFRKYLDLPVKKGGVGLNRQTAANFAKKLEMIMIKYNENLPPTKPVN
jgi:putative ABC transport system ATP-binding protein